MTQFSAGFADSVDSSASWEEQGDLDRKKEKEEKTRDSIISFHAKKKKMIKLQKHTCGFPFVSWSTVSPISLTPYVRTRACSPLSMLMVLTHTLSLSIMEKPRQFTHSFCFQ
jgi:hypothetical protein